MSSTVTIPIERASHEAFAPFGQLISEQGSPPVFHGDGLRSWWLAYDIDGTTELMFICYDYKPMIFSAIERHFNVTQRFIPLAGSGVVMVVAPRTDETDLSILPSPTSLLAFLLEGSPGALLWKGVFGIPSIGFRFNRPAPVLLCLPRPKRKGNSSANHTRVFPQD